MTGVTGVGNESRLFTLPLCNRTRVPKKAPPTNRHGFGYRKIAEAHSKERERENGEGIFHGLTRADAVMWNTRSHKLPSMIRRRNRYCLNIHPSWPCRPNFSYSARYSKIGRWQWDLTKTNTRRQIFEENDFSGTQTRWRRQRNIKKKTYSR